MARLSDLSVRHQLFMRTYRYRAVDWRPGARLRRPVHESRVATITTAAFHGPDQEPFDVEARGGDVGYRVIERGTDLATLRSSHKSNAFDTTGIERDPNVALPLQRLEDLAATGAIGDVSPVHFSFMGSISAPARLIQRSAPSVVRALESAKVDVVLLTPV